MYGVAKNLAKERDTQRQKKENNNNNENRRNPFTVELIQAW